VILVQKMLVEELYRMRKKKHFRIFLLSIHGYTSSLIAKWWDYFIVPVKTAVKPFTLSGEFFSVQ
jgi:hypothetical protein